MSMITFRSRTDALAGSMQVSPIRHALLAAGKPLSPSMQGCKPHAGIWMNSARSTRGDAWARANHQQSPSRNGCEAGSARPRACKERLRRSSSLALEKNPSLAFPGRPSSPTQLFLGGGTHTGAYLDRTPVDTGHLQYIQLSSSPPSLSFSATPILSGVRPSPLRSRLIFSFDVDRVRRKIVLLNWVLWLAHSSQNRRYRESTTSPPRPKLIWPPWRHKAMAARYAGCGSTRL